MGIKGIYESDILALGSAVVASAAAITITGRVTRITGAVTIGTINPPNGNLYFQGPLYLYNTDSSVGIVDTSGNCALQFTLTRYKIFTLIFDITTGKWYPSAVS